MIMVLDDFLTPSYADAIETSVKGLPYLYSNETSGYAEDIAYIITTPETKDYGQFVCPILHNLAKERLVGSYIFNELKVLYYTAQDRLQIPLTGLSRLKANILLRQPDAPADHYNIPHQDSINSSGNNLSMVYYCNDSDGDTFLFNEFYSETPPTRLTIAERIQPRKNRAVIFDSNRFHASSNPIKTEARFVLNFVIVK